MDPLDGVGIQWLHISQLLSLRDSIEDLGSHLSLEPDLVNDVWALGCELFLLVAWDRVSALCEVTGIIGENRKFFEFRGGQHVGRCRNSVEFESCFENE